MSPPDAPDAGPGRAARAEDTGGVFERAVARWFMRAARIAAVAQLSEHFRLIDFEGEALQNVAWAPGQKIQIKLDGGLLTRTYTPIHWDAVRGTTRILAYAHGAGPGNDWVRACAADTKRSLFGPRRSMDLENLPHQTILFGDETSFGLAMALQTRPTACTVHPVFEVTSLSESGKVLEGLGIEAHLIERREDKRHLTDVTRAIEPFVEGTTDFILSGNASSIQVVSRALKHAGVSPRRLRVKAYWAPGKRGLD